MSRPVVRRWEASIARGDVEDWLDTFKARAFPHMRTVPGFLGIRILVSREGDPCGATVLTTWEDMEAVRRYAGQEPARTVMPDFMAPFFPAYDAKATFHDEVMVELKR